MATLPTAGPPAALTLTTFRSNIRSGLNETTTIFWTDPEIDFSVNFVKDELWKVIKHAREDFFLYRSGTTPWRSLSIVDGTHSYELWSDVSEIRQIIPDPTVTDGTELYTFHPLNISHPEFIKARLASTTTDPGTPTEFFYDLVGSQHDGVYLIHFAPTPQANLTALVSYIRSLPDMTTADHTCDIPPEHHKIMIPMAVDYLLLKDRDDGYRIWRERWIEGREWVKATTDRRETAATEYVTAFNP